MYRPYFEMVLDFVSVVYFKDGSLLYEIVSKGTIEL